MVLSVSLSGRDDWVGRIGGEEWRREWYDLPEELAVPLGDMVGTIDSDHVAIMWQGLHNGACLGPCSWGLSCLVLGRSFLHM